MEKQKLSKSHVAKQMHTSRVAIDNILNPEYNTSIGTLERFASVLGKKLFISIQ
jgi:plasmid maintenance system antidote protein VapI